MARRSIMAVMVLVAMLMLAAPALAGGWATVTLDSLPREVRAGAALQLGFVVRQHGKTPTNVDLNGRALKPVLVAHKRASAAVPLTLLVAGAPSVRLEGETTLRVVARQEGDVGHYVADVTFPSDGVWEWQIEVPTFYVQDSPNGEGNAAIMAPLTVLPAAVAQPAAAQPAAAAAPETAAKPAPQAAPEPTSVLGLSPAALRWAGAILLLVAAGVILAAQRGALGRRRAARSQG